MIVPVFKTGGWRVTPSPVGSTPTRFRHYFSVVYAHLDFYLNWQQKFPVFGQRSFYEKPALPVSLRFGLVSDQDR